jgi:hypothetical protein
MSTWKDELEKALKHVDKRDQDAIERKNRAEQKRFEAYSARWSCSICGAKGQPERVEVGRSDEWFNGDFWDYDTIYGYKWNSPPDNLVRCTSCKRYVCKDTCSDECITCEKRYCLDHSSQGYCKKHALKIIKDSTRPWWWPSWLWF